MIIGTGGVVPTAYVDRNSIAVLTPLTSSKRAESVLHSLQEVAEGFRAIDPSNPPPESLVCVMTKCI